MEDSMPSFEFRLNFGVLFADAAAFTRKLDTMKTPVIQYGCRVMQCKNPEGRQVQEPNARFETALLLLLLKC